MAFELKAGEIATKVKLMHRQFAGVTDLAAQSFVMDAWPIVKRAELPDDLQELGVKLYTAHLMYNFVFGGQTSGSNQTLKVGPLEKATTGGSSQSYSKHDKDPFYIDWLDLVRRYGKGWGIGLAVVN